MFIQFWRKINKIFVQMQISALFCPKKLNLPLLYGLYCRYICAFPAVWNSRLPGVYLLLYTEKAVVVRASLSECEHFVSVGSAAAVRLFCAWRRSALWFPNMPDCPSAQNPVVYKALSLPPESLAAEGAVCFCYVFYCLHNNIFGMSGLLEQSVLDTFICI